MVMEVVYELTDFNPVGINDKKTQIILTDTKRGVKNYIQSLRYRYNRKNPFIPNYVISKTGEVYKIMEPNMYSRFLDNETLDMKSIIISLENFGCLKKNPLEDTYVNWIGDIYKQKAFERKWRDCFFWDRYETTQIDSLVLLLDELCEKFKIPKITIGHNVRQDGVENFKGIATRSNYDVDYKDVNPAFDFKLLEKKLKNDEPI
jgi:hypothetical protein